MKISKKEYVITKEIKEGREVITAIKKALQDAPNKHNLGFIIGAAGFAAANNIESAQQACIFGNWVPTVEEARVVSHSQKLKREYRRCIKDLIGDWKPDYNDGQQMKFLLTIASGRLVVYQNSSMKFLSDDMVFSSRAIGEKLMKDFKVDMYEKILEA